MNQQELDLANTWHQIVSELQTNQRAWLRNSQPVTLHGNTAILEVPNEFTRNQLEGRLRGQIEDSLSERLGQEIRIAVTVNSQLEQLPQPLYPPDDMSTNPQIDFQDEKDANESPASNSWNGNVVDLNERRAHTSASPEPPFDSDAAPGLPLTEDASASHHNTGESGGSHRFPPTTDPHPRPGLIANQVASAADTRLNSRYTFESFVVGSSNRFPHAAAVAVAEAPGKSYNPLLIHGDSGLGKTHLLHSIGHYVHNLYSGAKVRYVSSEEFTNEFINAVRDSRLDRFKRKYRDIDVLLIDDIQFLQGKDSTQDEFFHTFNHLHNANKQIVLTSDRMPKLLNGLEDRLRSRFEWGLITDVQAPDLETRIAILQKKANLERLTVPSDVLEMIASRVTTNIRELEGALIRVTAFANLNRQEVDLTLAQIVLKDLLSNDGEPEITIPLIMAQSAAYFGVSVEELTGPSRGRHLVLARQIAMYLSRELTSKSLPDIGKSFNRNHATVIFANNKIKDLLAERRAIYNQVTELTNRVKTQARNPLN